MIKALVLPGPWSGPFFFIKPPPCLFTKSFSNGKPIFTCFPSLKTQCLFFLPFPFPLSKSVFSECYPNGSRDLRRFKVFSQLSRIGQTLQKHAFNYMRVSAQISLSSRYSSRLLRFAAFLDFLETSALCAFCVITSFFSPFRHSLGASDLTSYIDDRTGSIPLSPPPVSKVSF